MAHHYRTIHTHELTFVALVAVVVLGACVIILKYGQVPVTPVRAVVEGARITHVDTPQELLNELKAGDSSLDSGDFVQLKHEASGL